MSGVYTYSYLKYEAKVSGATRRGVNEQTELSWARYFKGFHELT